MHVCFVLVPYAIVSLNSILFFFFFFVRFFSFFFFFFFFFFKSLTIVNEEMRQIAGRSALSNWCWFVRTLAKAHNGTFKDDRVMFKSIADSEERLMSTLTVFKDPSIDLEAKEDFNALVSNLEDVVTRLSTILGLFIAR